MADKPKVTGTKLPEVEFVRHRRGSSAFGLVHRPWRKLAVLNFLTKRAQPTLHEGMLF
jgi:hypothetical protein